MSRKRGKIRKSVKKVQEAFHAIPEYSKVNWFVDCSGPVLKKMLDAGGILIPAKFYPAVICGMELDCIKVCDEFSYNRTFDGFFEESKYEICKSVVGFKTKIEISDVIEDISREIRGAVVEVCDGRDLSYDEFLDEPLLLSKALKFIYDEFFEKNGYWELPRSLCVPYLEMLDDSSYMSEVFKKYEGTPDEELIAEGSYAAENIYCREFIRICEFGRNFIAWRYS